MLKAIQISTFRGIKHLDIDGLGKINIFVGENGSGKTTILESIFIAAYPTMPQNILTVGQWREMPLVNMYSDDILRSVFNAGNLSQDAMISFESTDGKISRLIIIPMVSEESVPSDSPASESASDAPTGAILVPPNFVNGIRLQFYPDEKIEDVFFESQVEANLAGHHVQQLHQAGTYKPMGAFYIHGRRATSAGDTAPALTRLHQLKQAEQFYEILRSINPRIKAMIPGVRHPNHPIVLADVGLPEFIPMNLLGDGFCRISLMVTGLMNNTIELLIVDEIDSGLHRSVMEKFWKELLIVSNKMHKQVFCTTHSEEMLVSTLGAFADDKEALRIFRIDPLLDGSTKATAYTYDTFQRSEKLGLDIR